MRSLAKLFVATAFLCLAICAGAAARPVSGSDSTVDCHLSGFTSIKIGGPFEIHITQGATESVKITAPADRMSHILKEVDHGVLKIRRKQDDWGWGINSWWTDKGIWRQRKKMVVYIVVKDVDRITISGSGNAVLESPISANKLKLFTRGSGSIEGKIEVTMLEGRVSGSGSMKLSGKAGIAAVKVSGSGHFTGRDLVTGVSSVLVTGSGNANISANDKIDATVHGSGAISYTGAPKSVSRSKSGSGSISSF